MADDERASIEMQAKTAGSGAMLRCFLNQKHHKHKGKTFFLFKTNSEVTIQEEFLHRLRVDKNKK